MSHWWDHPFVRSLKPPEWRPEPPVWIFFLTHQGSMETWHCHCMFLVWPLVLCADPLMRDAHVSSQGRPLPQALLSWGPSFCDLLSQAGLPSLCLALCPVASHHPELLIPNLRCKFSQLLVQWPGSSDGSQSHQHSALEVLLPSVGIFQTKGSRRCLLKLSFSAWLNELWLRL